MRRLTLLFFLSILLCSALEQGNVGYVVDQASGRVWIVDLAQRLLDQTNFLSGAGASQMVVTPNNRLGFVANRDAGTVSALDLRTNRILASIPLNQGPGSASLTASLDGQRVYVANAVSNTVSVIDTRTLTLLDSIDVGRAPVEIRTGPGGRYVYTVNRDSGTLSVIDVSRNRVTGTLTAGSQPRRLAIIPNRDIAYVVNQGSNNVTPVNLSNNTLAGNPIPVGSAPVDAAWSGDGAWLYVVNSGSNSVTVVNTGTRQQAANFTVGTTPVAMLVKPAANTGYVVNQGSNNVTCVNLSGNTPYKQIAVGTQPAGGTLDHNQEFLFVPNKGSGTVSIINVNSETTTGTISGPGGASSPVQFALLNPPKLLEVSPNPAPFGSRVTLTGEGFLQSTRVRFSPPMGLSITLAPFAQDNQILEIDVPPFQDPYVVVEVINADRSISAPLTLRNGTAAPYISSGGVVEAAGFQAAPYPISNNALVAVFGEFLGMTRADAPAFQFPLPRTLGNAKVTFNGVPGGLLATLPLAGYHQINAVAPLNLFGQNEVRVAVTIGNETSPAQRINAAPASPGIFVVSSDGSAAAVHTNGALVTPFNAAARGETILLFVTGLGTTNPLPPEGDAAPVDAVARTLLPVRVLVSGVDSPGVEFSGLAPGFSGLYQINFKVPSVPTVGVLDIMLKMGDAESNVAKLAVR